VHSDSMDVTSKSYHPDNDSHVMLYVVYDVCLELRYGTIPGIFIYRSFKDFVPQAQTAQRMATIQAMVMNVISAGPTHFGG
jgi:hypothetical protein